jgi:O-antigen/teichoic acid export membrane protein
MSLFSILAMSFTESASKHINKKDGAIFISKVFNASIRLFGSIGLVLIAFCPFIINTFIGKEFRSAKQYVPILIASAFLSSAVSLLGAVYIAMKKTKAVASIAVMAAIMNFAFTFLLIGYIKIYAAAIATLLSFLIILIQRSINIKKYITIQFDRKIYAFIALCYSATFTLYYLNNTVCTIINCLFVLFIAVKLNSNSIILLRTKVLERIRFNKARIGLIDENL